MKEGSQEAHFMSHPFWIREELGRHFSGFDLDVGIDLDKDGSIEGAEQTDINGDGAVDVAEWRRFLTTNEASLSALGGFFNSYLKAGQAFSPDNPIHDLLAIEAEDLPPHAIAHAYQFMEEITGAVRNLVTFEADGAASFITFKVSTLFKLNAVKNAISARFRF